MIDGQLIPRKTSDDPIIYRVTFDNGTGPVEVGSVSLQTRHVYPIKTYWHRGIDTNALGRLS